MSEASLYSSALKSAGKLHLKGSKTIKKKRKRKKRSTDLEFSAAPESTQAAASSSAASSSAAAAAAADADGSSSDPADRQRFSDLRKQVRSLDKAEEKVRAVIGGSLLSSELQSDFEKALDRRTPAERAYDAAQAKRRGAIVKKMAEKSHREKVAEYNERLSKLSEHHDMPRVSYSNG